MTKILTEERDFRCLFAESRDAFRFEHQRDPLGEEAPALEHWLAGGRTVPWEWAPWQSWLERVRHHTSGAGTTAAIGSGKAKATVNRVRLVDEPPTDYQRWSMSITMWHAQAGDMITYLPLSEAGRLGIPDSNWWLFDSANLVLLDYSGDAFPRMTLVTDPKQIRIHQRWRTLAEEHARVPVMT